MNSRTLSTLAVVGFLLVGGVLLGLRYRSLRQVETAREESEWRLTYDVRFEALTDPTARPPIDTTVRLAVPFETRYCEVLPHPPSSIHPELKFVERRPLNRTHEILISTSQPKTLYTATATFDLRLSPREDMSREPPLESLSRDTRSLYLRNEDVIPINSAPVQAAVDALPDEAVTDAERVQAIFDDCVSIEAPATEDAADSADIALSTKSGSALARARAMVAMCRASNIPARLVTGFDVKQQSKAQPRVWVEVFLGQRWEPYDPEFGYTQTLPMTYVPVRRGGDKIWRTNLARIVAEVYSIVRLPPDQRILRVDEEHPSQILDLTRLPVPMHDVLSILLLLPFGALITAFMRNVVGIQTFGTFAPALLAMSFIYADPKTGLMILLVVISVGLVGRSLLERLRLLTVPRLSIILTTVILCVVFGLSILYYFFPEITANTVLLPMVILTILIERFHVTVDEDGVVYALQLTVGTVVVAILCYAVLNWKEVGEFVLTYPEAHFFTIAGFILLGRYAGYRMTELWRFRDLVESSEVGR